MSTKTEFSWRIGSEARGKEVQGVPRMPRWSVAGNMSRIVMILSICYSVLYGFIWIYTDLYGFMMASWCYISCFGFEVLIILISSCYISWKQTWLNIGSVHFGCAREGLLTSGEGILMVSSQLCLVTIRINHLWIRHGNGMNIRVNQHDG